MKRIAGIILFISCLALSYSQEISEKKERKAVEQIREEIQSEKKIKEKRINNIEKRKTAIEKEKIRWGDRGRDL